MIKTTLKTSMILGAALAGTLGAGCGSKAPATAAPTGAAMQGDKHRCNGADKASCNGAAKQAGMAPTAAAADAPADKASCNGATGSAAGSAAAPDKATCSAKAGCNGK